MNASRIKALKFLCIFLCLVYCASAFFGIQSISMTPAGTAVRHLTAGGRVWTLLSGGFCALCAYGLHTHSLITWRAGFVVLVLGYIDALWGGTHALSQVTRIRDFPSFWLPTLLVTVLGGAVTLYWIRWWMRQRPYFQ